MRYKTEQYAEAFVEALDGVNAETAHACIRTFAEMLKKHRVLGKAESIARAVERRLALLAGATRVMLATADASSDSLQKELAEIFDGKIWLEEKICPDLLAGVRILIDDETLIDASGKRQLAQMFQTH